MTEKDLKDSGDDANAKIPTYTAYADDVRDEEPTMPEGDTFTIDAYDKYIGAVLQLPLQDAMTSATVKARKQDHEGNPVGKSNPNPLLDTRVYKVEFPDGSTEEYAANLIAENMYAQVDDEGRQFNILSELVDHKKNDNATSDEDSYATIRGIRHPLISTKGREFFAHC